MIYQGFVLPHTSRSAKTKGQILTSREALNYTHCIAPRAPIAFTVETSGHGSLNSHDKEAADLVALFILAGDTRPIAGRTDIRRCRVAEET